MGIFKKLFGGERLPELSSSGAEFAPIDSTQAYMCPNCRSTAKHAQQAIAQSRSTTEYALTCSSCSASWKIRVTEVVTYE